MSADVAGINLAPSEPALDGRYLDQLIDVWLVHCRATLDAATAENYRHKIVHFRRWWASVGPSCGWVLREADFVTFARRLEFMHAAHGGPLAYGTRHDVLRRLRQMLRWAHAHGYVPVDFGQCVPTLRGSSAPRQPVELDTLGRLMAACDQTRQPIRNRAIIAMLAGTGIRCEECAALEVQRVKIYADGSGYVGLSVAKNDKLRNVAFDAVTGTYLCAWLVQLPYDRGPVFRSYKRGAGGRYQAISPNGLYRAVVAVAELAGARDEVRGPHDLRRLFATTWHKVQPETISHLQHQLGHSNLSTTMIYILNHSDEAGEIIRQQPVTPMAQMQLRLGDDAPNA